MSLYLQVAVGAGRYLLDAEHLLEIRDDVRDRDGAVRWQGAAVPVADLRGLFGDTDGTYGSCILVTQSTGEAAALLVDRVEGLVEIGDEEFRPLPPIGPLGPLIDAVSARPAGGPPALRLRGECALAAIAGCE